MPVITLNNLSLAFGEDQILDHAELSIERGDRIALTGRNGAGKSTLLGLIMGRVIEDDGSIWRADSQAIVALSQDLPDRTEQTVYDAVAGVFETLGKQLARYHALTQSAGSASDQAEMAKLHDALDHADGWDIQYRIDATLDRLKLEPEATLKSLSGGWLKRVAIAQSLVQSPDIWILDEPTNHLDLEGIRWLEQLLLDFPGTLIFVSHDRQLMQSVASAVVEIDRGRLTRYDCRYQTFIERRDKAREVEAEHNKLFDEKLKNEEIWIRQGIKARRTRNEGRVRALEALREERARRVTLGQLKLQADSGSASGKIVKEVTGLTKSIAGNLIVKDLDLIIQRGDRIGLLGPNGCGKSTLLKLLLGELQPDSGQVKTGTKLQVAYFDQVREQLDQKRSVHDYIAEGRDFLTINGKDLHIISYLQNFLFSPDQSRAPIRTLSGGEQNRLLLAKLFAMPTNLLVLDEPTNDLDIETLELLEELLMDYQGTVLLVSHDRIFMDNVVSSLLVFEGNARVQEYVGGYADWAKSWTATGTPKKPSGPVKKAVDKPAAAPLDHETRKRQKAAQQKRERDLAKVTGRIEKVETEIAALTEKMGTPAFPGLSAEAQAKEYDKAAALQVELETLMAEWETLEAGQF